MHAHAKPLTKVNIYFISAKNILFLSLQTLGPRRMKNQGIRSEIFTKKMEINRKSPTIFEVAQLAGVSRGTVDRVVYGRGRVSQETVNRVRDAIAKLGYSPNPNASSLASKKEYRFACLIPKFTAGDYWEEIYRGLARGQEEIVKYNIRLDVHLYNQIDPASFRECCDKVLEDQPSGVIMNAVFKDEVIDFATRLEEARIPYSFLDNKLDELNYLMYYGVDPYKSGALGAFLLTTRCKVEEIALVRLVRDSLHKADPNAQRRHGFLDYIEENLPGCSVHTIFIEPDKPQKTEETLEKFFRERPGVRHIAMTNSRVWLIDEYLRNHPDPQRIVVGFDDLEKNLACLRSGDVEFLVTRHIPQQASRLLKEFTECVITGKIPARRNNFVHMDILHRRNLDDYR